MHRRLTCSILLGLIGALAHASPAHAETKPQDVACAFDRTGLRTMDLAAFDQSAQGWRALAGKGAACNSATADLIAEYRRLRPDIMRGNINSYLLYWHEGQTRAFDGQYREAWALIERSRVQGIPVFEGWNLYADATAAFLRRDRTALLQARTALAALPPEDAHPGAKPANLDVVDGLIRCFDRSYAEAYSTCRGAD
jgi:hypothetical protein